MQRAGLPLFEKIYGELQASLNTNESGGQVV
jgi:hypothetical protein